MKTAIILIGGILGLGGGGLLLAGMAMKAKGGWGPQANGTEVRIATVEGAELIETISAPGDIEPHTDVDISSEVSARIMQLPFREGDEIRKDDVIVRLDDRNLKAALTASEARRDSELARREAELERKVGLNNTRRFALIEVQRIKALHETGDVSDKDLEAVQERIDDVDTQLRIANHNLSAIESSLTSAQADIDQANEALLKTIVRSPMDGVITMLNAEVGEVMLGTVDNPGTVIMTIADLNRMQINARVAESDVADCEVGQPCTVHLRAYPDIDFSGAVTHIGLQRQVGMDGTGFFKTEIEIDLQGRRLRSGLTGNVDVEIGRHHGIVVEDQAIRDVTTIELPSDLRRNDPLVDLDRKVTSCVFRVIDGKAIATPVVMGASDLTHTLILDGLEAGERVIVGPFKALDELEPGNAVKDIEAAAEAEAATDTGDTSDAEDGNLEDGNVEAETSDVDP